MVRQRENGQERSGPVEGTARENHQRVRFTKRETSKERREFSFFLLSFFLSFFFLNFDSFFSFFFFSVNFTLKKNLETLLKFAETKKKSRIRIDYVRECVLSKNPDVMTKLYNLVEKSKGMVSNFKFQVSLTFV